MSTLKSSFKMVVVSILCIQSLQCFQELESNNPEIIALTHRQNEKIDEKALFVPNRLGDISVYHDDNGFRVKDSLESYAIQRCFMDKELRGISKKNLAKLLAADAYLSVNKLDGCNEYSLRLNSRLRGGGALGAAAGFWTGKFLTHLVAQVGIAVATGVTALVCPPAAPAVFLALQSTVDPAAEVASNVVGLGVGVVGAVVTGPI